MDEVTYRETKEKLLLWYDSPEIPEKYRKRIRSWLWGLHGIDPLGILGQ